MPSIPTTPVERAATPEPNAQLAPRTPLAQPQAGNRSQGLRTDQLTLRSNSDGSVPSLISDAQTFSDTSIATMGRPAQHPLDRLYASKDQLVRAGISEDSAKRAMAMHVAGSSRQEIHERTNISMDLLSEAQYGNISNEDKQAINATLAAQRRHRESGN